MQQQRSWFWMVVMAILLIVLPLISYLLVRQGALIRQHAAASEYIKELPGGLPPDQLFISQRGDTLTAERLLGKVVVVECINSTSAGKTGERHPLFEIQEAYEGKTLNLRFMSVWEDTGRTATTADLAYFGSRFAVRENWHVVSCGQPESLLSSIDENFYNGEKKSGDSDLFFPHVVYVLNKEGHWCATYKLDDQQAYDALFNDLLYLIDR